MRSVLPALQARVFPHRISLHAIDLRWGVTEEETRRNRYRDTGRKGWDERMEWCSPSNHGGTARTNDGRAGLCLLDASGAGGGGGRGEYFVVFTLPCVSQGPASSLFLPGSPGIAPSDPFLSPLSCLQTTRSVPWGGGELTAVCGDSGLPLWLHSPQL